MKSHTLDTSGRRAAKLGQTRMPWGARLGYEQRLLFRPVDPGTALLLAGAAVVIAGIAHALAGSDQQRMWVLLMLAPLAEEAIFRTGVQEGLLRRGLPNHIANLLTALLFALAHVWLHGDIAAFGVALPALLVGSLYGRTRRLLPCVLLHSAMNGAWVTWHLALPLGPAFP